MRPPYEYITIVELEGFLKESKKVLSDDEKEELKWYLAANPEAGDSIPGLRGIRKVRWQTEQKGKSGGARIIYFYYNQEIPLFLLSIYKKSDQTDLTSKEKVLLSRLVDELIESYGEWK